MVRAATTYHCGYRGQYEYMQDTNYVRLKVTICHPYIVRLYFCSIFACVFRLVLPFGNLIFIHASTNATDHHKYSPYPFEILLVPEFWYQFIAFIFSEKSLKHLTKTQTALRHWTKVCSVLVNIRDVLWHFSKRGSELKKRCTFAFWKCRA